MVTYPNGELLMAFGVMGGFTRMDSLLLGYAIH